MQEIINSDNYCLIRAIFIAIAFIENDSSKYDIVKRPTNKKLMDEVHKAVAFCKIGNRACTINDLIKLEAYYKHYQIMLIDETYNLTNKILYLKHQDKFNKYIY